MISVPSAPHVRAKADEATHSPRSYETKSKVGSMGSGESSPQQNGGMSKIANQTTLQSLYQPALQQCTTEHPIAVVICA